MSGKEGNGDNSHDETEPRIKKPTATKKYPFQTATRRNNPEKLKQAESNEDLKNQRGKSENEIDKPVDSDIGSLKQVVNKPIKQNSSSSKIINKTLDYQSSKDSSIKIDGSKIKDDKPQLDETPTENKIKLDLVEVAETQEGRKKIRRKDLTKKEIDEICGDRDGKGGEKYTKTKTPGVDPRFQQQDQTMRCFVMYTDFYRCENILGEGEMACQWFKDVFTSICPLDWIRRWDEARDEGRLGWTKGRTQGKFPGNRYGV